MQQLQSTVEQALVHGHAIAAGDRKEQRLTLFQIVIELGAKYLLAMILFDVGSANRMHAQKVIHSKQLHFLNQTYVNLNGGRTVLFELLLLLLRDLLDRFAARMVGVPLRDVVSVVLALVRLTESSCGKKIRLTKGFPTNRRYGVHCQTHPYWTFLSQLALVPRLVRSSFARKLLLKYVI